MTAKISKGRKGRKGRKGWAKKTFKMRVNNQRFKKNINMVGGGVSATNDNADAKDNDAKDNDAKDNDANKKDIIHASSVIIVAIISWIVQAFKNTLVKKEDVTDTQPDQMKQTVKVAAKTWIQVFKNLVEGINQSILNLANNAESFASNGILDFIPWLGNPNIIQRSSIKKELADRTNQINAIMNSDVKQELQQLISAIVNLNIDLLSDISGPAETMITKALEILTNVGERTGRGIMTFIINVAMSAVGEIPVVGGLIDLIMSILRGINSGLQTGAPIANAITSGLVTSILTLKQVFKSLSKINDETKVGANITSGGGVVGRGNKSMINNGKNIRYVGKKTNKQINK
jgi:hypothetical protein